MKIVYYELYKLITKKALILALLSLVILNLYLLWNRSASDIDLINDTHIIAVYSDISKFETNEEKIRYLDNKINEYSVYANLFWFDLFGNVLDNEFAYEQYDEYVNKYLAGEYTLYSGDVLSELSLYQAVHNEVSNIINYEELLLNMEENAKIMMGYSLLIKPDSYAYKNIIKTPAAYEHLKDIDLTIDIPYGVEQATDNIAIDIIAIPIILVSVFIIFSDEKASSMFSLTRTTRNGHGQLLFSKVIAIFLWCSIIVLVFFVSSLLLMELKFGLGNLSRQIQSVNVFIGSILNISVTSYLFLYFFTKTIAYFIIALITIFVCLLVKNDVTAYILIGIILTVQILLFITISPMSQFSILRYLNIISFTQPNEIFGNYFNINAFGEPINIISFSIITASILIILLLFALLLISKKPFFTIWNKILISEHFDRIINSKIHTSIFTHEMYKVLITNRVFLLLILLAIIQWNNFTNYRSFTTIDEAYYKSYVEQAGGIVTRETFEFIKHEEAYFDDIKTSLEIIDEKYQNGEIDTENYSLTIIGLRQLLAPQKGFEIFKDRVEYIYTNNLNEGQVVYDKGFNILFSVNGYNDDMEQVLLLIIFLVIMLSPCYTDEKENGIFWVEKSTLRGLTHHIRFYVNVIIALITFAIVYMPFIINTVTYHGITGSEAVIQSIPIFSNFSLSISIRTYILFLLTVRIIGVMITVFIIQMISLYSTKKTSSMLISLSLIAIPAAVYFTGVESLANIGLNALLGGNALLHLLL